MARYQTILSIPRGGEETEVEVEVAYDVSWGQAPSGQFGPPEHYDPGSADEVESLVVLKVDGEAPDPALAPAIRDWIYDNREDELIADAREQTPDGPDPDDARDQAYDDQRWD